MEFTPGLPNLEKVHLDGCTDLRDILDLARLPRLALITLPPLEEEIVDILEKRSQSPHLEIHCDSFYTVGQAVS
ncbi:hypothetical protein ACQP1W_00640 [Spirillospora sp. CA-255316]